MTDAELLNHLAAMRRAAVARNPPLDYVAVSTVAEQLGVSRPQLRRVLKQMADMGLVSLRRERRSMLRWNSDARREQLRADIERAIANRTRLTRDEIARETDAKAREWRRNWLEVTNSISRRQLEAFAKGDEMVV